MFNSGFLIVCIVDCAVFVKRNSLMAKVGDEPKQKSKWNRVCWFYYQCYSFFFKSTNKRAAWKVFIFASRRHQRNVMLGIDSANICNQSAERNSQ